MTHTTATAAGTDHTARTARPDHTDHRTGVSAGRPAAARLMRATLAACLVLGSALGAGSCAPRRGVTPVGAAPAPRPVRSDWGMQGCKETAVVEAPVCGGGAATHGL